MTLRPIAFGLLVSLVGLGSGTRASQDRQVFRAAVDAVRIDVLATDRGRPIAGLTAADFEVRDNGVLQTVDLATQAGAIHVVQVLDTSGSVHGPTLRQLKDAAAAGSGMLRPGDRMSLLTFSERILLHAHAAADPVAIRQAIEGMTEGGRTSLLDAVYAGLAFATPDQGRSLVIVYSDGLDNASWLSHWNIAGAVDRSDVVIYTVAVEWPGQLPGQRDESGILPQIAQRSSGEFLLTSDKHPLESIFAEIFSQFRARYLVTYTPQGVKRDDGWHKLSVKLRGRSGRVKARDGYMAVSRPRT
jgi:VWFA-related protein